VSAPYKRPERRILHSHIPAQVAVSNPAASGNRRVVVYTGDVCIDFASDEEAARSAAWVHNVVNGHTFVADRRVGR